MEYLSAHDTVGAGHLKALFDVRVVVDSPICQYRYAEGLLDLSYEVPVADAHRLLILLFRAAVHRQQFTSSFLNSLAQLKGGLLTFQHSHLAEQGYLQPLRHGLHYPHYQVWLTKQVRTVMAPPSYSLRTSEVQIDGIHLILQHASSLQQRLGIVATELSDQRSIFLAGGEMLVLIGFLGDEHARVQHRRIAQVAPVATAEQTECQLTLVDHGCADQQRCLSEELRQLIHNILNYSGLSTVNQLHWSRYHGLMVSSCWSKSSTHSGCGISNSRVTFLYRP